MNILIVGASRGLGRAFVDGLPQAGDQVIGVSRTQPIGLAARSGVELQWVQADFAHPVAAVDKLERHCPDRLDLVIYNLGIWEEKAFTEDYAFVDQADASIEEMVHVNVTGPLVLIRRLLPRLLQSKKPQIILTGSTSGLPWCGGPEVTLSATKSALSGMADALRASYRDRGLAVACLQLGDLNTDDDLSVAPDMAANRDKGYSVPVHDVVALVQSMLQLTGATVVREIVVPAIRDRRF